MESFKWNLIYISSYFLIVVILIHGCNARVCTSSANCRQGECCRNSVGQLFTKDLNSQFSEEQHGLCRDVLATLNEPCDQNCMCRPGLQCALVSTTGSRICQQIATAVPRPVPQHPVFNPQMMPINTAIQNINTLLAHQMMAASSMSHHSIAPQVPRVVLRDPRIVGQQVIGGAPNLKSLDDPSVRFIPVRDPSITGQEVLGLSPNLKHPQEQIDWNMLFHHPVLSDSFHEHNFFKETEYKPQVAGVSLQNDTNKDVLVIEPVKEDSFKYDLTGQHDYQFFDMNSLLGQDRVNDSNMKKQIFNVPKRPTTKNDTLNKDKYIKKQNESLIQSNDTDKKQTDTSNLAAQLNTIIKQNVSKYDTDNRTRNDNKNATENSVEISSNKTKDSHNLIHKRDLLIPISDIPDVPHFINETAVIQSNQSIEDHIKVMISALIDTDNDVKNKTGLAVSGKETKSGIIEDKRIVNSLNAISTQPTYPTEHNTNAVKKKPYNFTNDKSYMKNDKGDIKFEMVNLSLNFTKNYSKDKANIVNDTIGEQFSNLESPVVAGSTAHGAQQSKVDDIEGNNLNHIRYIKSASNTTQTKYPDINEASTSTIHDKGHNQQLRMSENTPKLELGFAQSGGNQVIIAGLSNRSPMDSVTFRYSNNFPKDHSNSKSFPSTVAKNFINEQMAVFSLRNSKQESLQKPKLGKFIRKHVINNEVENRKEKSVKTAESINGHLTGHRPVLVLGKTPKDKHLPSSGFGSPERRVIVASGMNNPTFGENLRNPSGVYKVVSNKDKPSKRKTDLNSNSKYNLNTNVAVEDGKMINNHLGSDQKTTSSGKHILYPKLRNSNVFKYRHGASSSHKLSNEHKLHQANLVDTDVNARAHGNVTKSLSNPGGHAVVPETQNSFDNYRDTGGVHSQQTDWVIAYAPVNQDPNYHKRHPKHNMSPNELAMMGVGSSFHDNTTPLMDDWIDPTNHSPMNDKPELKASDVSITQVSTTRPVFKPTETNLLKDQIPVDNEDNDSINDVRYNSKNEYGTALGGDNVVNTYRKTHTDNNNDSISNNSGSRSDSSRNNINGNNDISININRNDEEVIESSKIEDSGGGSGMKRKDDSNSSKSSSRNGDNDVSSNSGNKGANNKDDSSNEKNGSGKDSSDNDDKVDNSKDSSSSENSDKDSSASNDDNSRHNGDDSGKDSSSSDDDDSNDKDSSSDNDDSSDKDSSSSSDDDVTNDKDSSSSDNSDGSGKASNSSRDDDDSSDKDSSSSDNDDRSDKDSSSSSDNDDSSDKNSSSNSDDDDNNDKDSRSENDDSNDKDSSSSDNDDSSDKDSSSSDNDGSSDKDSSSSSDDDVSNDKDSSSSDNSDGSGKASNSSSDDDDSSDKESSSSDNDESSDKDSSSSSDKESSSNSVDDDNSDKESSSSDNDERSGKDSSSNSGDDDNSDKDSSNSSDDSSDKHSSSKDNDDSRDKDSSSNDNDDRSGKDSSSSSGDDDSSDKDSSSSDNDDSSDTDSSSSNDDEDHYI